VPPPPPLAAAPPSHGLVAARAAAAAAAGGKCGEKGQKREEAETRDMLAPPPIDELYQSGCHFKKEANELYKHLVKFPLPTVLVCFFKLIC
jgi:hypothetical protein